MRWALVCSSGLSLPVTMAMKTILSMPRTISRAVRVINASRLSALNSGGIRASFLRKVQNLK